MLARLKQRLSLGRGSTLPDDPFDPDFFSRLDRVRLRFARASGARSGETPVRGVTQDSGIEVESFKTYTPGDDIRYVDWSAVGRLDTLLTRRFVAEREIPVHFLVDASASMATPEGDGKFAFARHLVAALAYVALNNNESVRLAALAANGGFAESPLLRHRGRYLTLKPFLVGVAAGGPTALADGVGRYLERHGREGGVVFLVSDFLVEDAEYERALVLLRSRRLDVRAVHVVGRGERTLDGLGGRYRLRDVETGTERDVALGERERRRYREEFDARLGRLRDFCHRYGIGHAVAHADEGAEVCLTRTLPSQGMVRLR
jgi:uncharacterized protein (DUF58 family)